jgi:uncharacterized membrane protein
MTQFADAMKEFDFPELEEVANEIRNHIAEARAAGRPLDAVLESLGPADMLARTYAAELLLNRSSSGRFQSVGSFLRVTSLVAVVSLVSLAVVGVLGSMGVGFIASGLTIITIGALEQAGIHLSGVQMAGVSPLVAMALGVAVLVVGGGAWIGLRLYVRLVIRSANRYRRATRPISTLA